MIAFMLIRRAAAALLVLVALMAFLLADVNGAGMDRTIKNGLQLDGQFKTVAVAMEGFRSSHGRLPSVKELGAVLPPSGLGHYDVMVSFSGFDQCVRDVSKYRDLAGSDYVLIAWRGEWWECYAPTKSMSTILVQPAAYTMFGAVWRDTLAYVSFAALCLLVAFNLGMRRELVE